MANTLTKIKLKQENSKYNFEDSSAVKKIQFNNITYSPDEEGIVTFDDSLANELKTKNIIVKEIYNYGDEYEASKNKLYIVKENVNEKFSGFSMFTMDDDLKLQRLSTPTIKFQTEDLDFLNILNTSYPKFMTWFDLVNSNIYTDLKKIKGIDVFNREVNESKKLYFCKKEFDEDTYITEPFVVYREVVNNEVFYIKQFVNEDEPDGTLTFISGKATKCSSNDTPFARNTFARTIEKK